MNILFLVARYPDETENTILEKDLVRIFAQNNHSCYVVSLNERKYNRPTYSYQENNINILKPKTGNMFGAKGIEKGLTVLTLPYILNNAIIKEFGSVKFDLIIAYTPFMANPTLLNELKKKHRCKTVLILWDIFPQNAKDLELVNNLVIFKYFKYKEELMLKTFDYIACNSEGNISYLANNYNYLKKENLFLARNCEFPLEDKIKKQFEIREKFGFLNEDKLFIFGGNMGIPQKLENLLSIAKNLEQYKFILIGEGTEKKKLIEKAKELKNVYFLDSLERKDYEALLCNCDFGVISLNEKYTVPNFPAKVTGYVKLGIPIIAILDSVAFNDLGKFIEENEIGIALEANNIDVNKVRNYIENYRVPKKNKFDDLFEKEFHIKNAYNAIMKKILE